MRYETQLEILYKKIFNQSIFKKQKKKKKNSEKLATRYINAHASHCINNINNWKCTIEHKHNLACQRPLSNNSDWYFPMFLH